MNIQLIASVPAPISRQSPKEESIRPQNLISPPARRNPMFEPALELCTMQIMSISLRYAPPKGAIGAS